MVEKRQLSRVMRKPDLSSGFSTRSDTNRAVQPHKMVRGLKLGFRRFADCTIYVVKTKARSAGQLLRTWSAPLFSHMQKAGFQMT